MKLFVVVFGVAILAAGEIFKFILYGSFIQQISCDHVRVNTIELLFLRML